MDAPQDLTNLLGPLEHPPASEQFGSLCLLNLKKPRMKPAFMAPNLRRQAKVQSHRTSVKDVPTGPEKNLSCVEPQKKPVGNLNFSTPNTSYKRPDLGLLPILIPISVGSVFNGFRFRFFIEILLKDIG